MGDTLKNLWNRVEETLTKLDELVAKVKNPDEIDLPR